MWLIAYMGYKAWYERNNWYYKSYWEFVQYEMKHGITPEQSVVAWGE